MVRASAWDRIGGADERLHPVYYVDVDLCMAIRQLGLAVLYQPASRTRHRRGATQTYSFKAFLAKRNRLLFLEKWGAVLEQHEPHVSRSPAAIERALGRAEAVGERARSAAAGRAVVPRAAFDPAEQERRLREHSHGLREAYVSHLEAALKGGEESIKQAAEMQQILGSRSALARRLARNASVRQSQALMRRCRSTRGLPRKKNAAAKDFSPRNMGGGVRWDCVAQGRLPAFSLLAAVAAGQRASRSSA